MKWKILKFSRDLIINDINNLSPDGYGKMYQSILFFSLLDIFETIYDPKEISPGKRSKQLVNELGDWVDGQKVCLILLWRLIYEANENRFDNAKWKILDRIYEFPQRGEIITLFYDISFEESLSLLDGVNINNKKEVSDLKHVNLLWESRNSMVHSLNPNPWQSIDLHEVSEPYYMRITLLGLSPKKIIVPIYPVGFIRKITSTCLRNLLEYCENKNINAFSNALEAMELYWPNWLTLWSETWLPT